MTLSYIRIKNVEKTEAIKKLKESKAKFLGNSLEKQLRFKLDQSEKFQNKNIDKFKGNSWLTVNFKDGVSTIEIDESNFDGNQKDHSALNVDDFLKATKMVLTMMPKKDYDYIEIKKDIYWLDGVTIVLEELPALKSTIIFSGGSKKILLELKKKLKIKGTLEPNFVFNTAEKYYSMRGVEYDIVKTILKKNLQKSLQSK
ncbi:MAG: hypothetical protein QXD23_01570 [Candidatus Micrarchaeaceae archaeon]